MSRRRASPYDDAFFEREEEAVLQSARTVVPLLLDLVKPTSIVDVGCGRGAWLRAFQEHGIGTLRGLDGPHVTRSKLLIDPACFTVVELARPFAIGEHYDLALCLEVAEHLPEKTSRSLVTALTTAAPLILFSAAIPGQGGTSHMNEQWPSYWEARFAERQFRRLDPVRRHVWHDARVKWYYRQNMLLYASPEAIARSTTLQAEDAFAAQTPSEWVHIKVLHRHMSRLATPQGILRELARAAVRAVTRRLGQPG